MPVTRAPKRLRQERILTELKAAPALRVSSLAREFGVSTETIRRDLDALSRDGLISRTYGGAARGPVAQEPALNERDRLLVDERAAIARAAAALVAPNEVLMVDAGSTTAHFARRLAAEFSDLTVITNSISVAAALAMTPSIRVVLCPGDYDGQENGVYGPDTLAFLEQFSATRCFVGCSSLSGDGPGDASSSAAWVKRRMIERSGVATLLVDHSKYGQAALETICALERVDDIVTDARPDRSLSEALNKAGVNLVVAG